MIAQYFYCKQDLVMSDLAGVAFLRSRNSFFTLYCYRTICVHLQSASQTFNIVHKNQFGREGFSISNQC